MPNRNSQMPPAAINQQQSTTYNRPGAQPAPFRRPGPMPPQPGGGPGTPSSSMPPLPRTTMPQGPGLQGPGQMPPTQVPSVRPRRQPPRPIAGPPGQKNVNPRPVGIMPPDARNRLAGR